jgi:5-methyltetrahydrofolate--homocysteine methyltransferase
MVPSDKILEEAMKEKVDIIGLSGLITPSLEEMVKVATKMEEQNFNIPLLIGGATTSKIHTAVKIDPEYHNPVIYVQDASRSVKVVSSLLSANKEAYFKETKKEYSLMRDARNDKGSGNKYINIDIARKNKLTLNWNEVNITTPSFLGIKSFTNFPIHSIIPYIDWTFFFHTWELKGKFPAILDHPQKGNEAKKLYKDALDMLKQIDEKNTLQANGVIGFYPANSIEDDIIIFEDDNRRKEVMRLFQLRQQKKRRICLIYACRIILHRLMQIVMIILGHLR